MKVVLFCGGLGTRIRDYSEAIPKPMIPVGHQPILLHIMQYYSHYGHRDFVLCLGYKSNAIKDYFLNVNPSTFSDIIISEYGKKVEVLGASPPDWRVALVDTGVWRNIGERLMAVRHLVRGEEFFLANYSDGLTDAPLPQPHRHHVVVTVGIQNGWARRILVDMENRGSRVRPLHDDRDRRHSDHRPPPPVHEISAAI
jgi:glucose-1-phosphate cytidylyltransferase